MSSLEKRLEVFRKLPLRAQLATILSSKANSVLSQNREYIDSLERIHQECLDSATPQAKKIYQQSVAQLRDLD